MQRTERRIAVRPGPPVRHLTRGLRSTKARVITHGYCLSPRSRLGRSPHNWHHARWPTNRLDALDKRGRSPRAPRTNRAVDAHSTTSGCLSARTRLDKRKRCRLDLSADQMPLQDVSDHPQLGLDDVRASLATASDSHVGAPIDADLGTGDERAVVGDQHCDDPRDIVGGALAPFVEPGLQVTEEAPVGVCGKVLRG